MPKLTLGSTAKDAARRRFREFNITLPSLAPATANGRKYLRTMHCNPNGAGRGDVGPNGARPR